MAAEPPVRDLGYAADQRLVAGALLGLQLLADEIDELKSQYRTTQSLPPGPFQLMDARVLDDDDDDDDDDEAVIADIVDQLAELTAQVKKLTKAVERGSEKKEKKKKEKSKALERFELE